MKTKYLSLYMLLAFAGSNYAQVVIKNSTTEKDVQINPDTALELQVKEKNKGIILPKVNLTNLTSSSPFTAHYKGMIVYNLTNNTTNNLVPGLYYNDGVKWALYGTKTEATSKEAAAIGDLKYSYSSSDANGWYLLDGRSISSLPNVAQTNAQTINLAGTLPNGENLFLAGKNTGTLGGIIGNSGVVLNQNHLPNITKSITFSNAGLHNHKLEDIDMEISNYSIFRISNLRDPVNSSNSRWLTTVSTTSEADRVISNAGAHTHTFSATLDSPNTAIDNTPLSIAANIFIYLGN